MRPGSHAAGLPRLRFFPAGRFLFHLDHPHCHELCTDALRKRRDAVSLDALREEQGFDVPDAAPTAYARLEEHERLRLLREGLSLLPADMREMIVLRDVQGKSYEEIGEILDVPLGTVKSRVSRAREKLSVILKKSSELFSSSPV
jgi:RNA polymerase sigma-70 factor (ECF subfamily)